MSTRRRLLALLDKRWGRRLVIAPMIVIAAIVGVVTSPIIAIVCVVLDVVRRRSRFPTLRLAGLIVGALVIETIGMAVAFASLVLTGFNRFGSLRWRWQLHRPLMGWYTQAMLWLIMRVIGTRAEWRDTADLEHGPVVLIARHTSFFDALLPGVLLCRRNRLLAHHIVTHGLRYSPCIDIFGHRFPNRFIKRTPGDGSAELEHIADVGGHLDERSAAIIFPEGTFRNPERFERVVRRLGRREPELAERARSLNHVLPPRANGTFALLEGAPSADLVVCTNTGFESFGSIKDIVSRPFTDLPIAIETWRIPRIEIPKDLDSFSTWLFDQFVIIDEWVEAQSSPN